MRHTSLCVVKEPRAMFLQHIKSKCLSMTISLTALRMMTVLMCHSIVSWLSSSIADVIYTFILELLLLVQVWESCTDRHISLT